ncbi:MAG: zinc-dependent alcohol dehydrogenase [Promethearchaeota archaeon]|jgi:2-desacetyl-2-hydroxyethyl bacteriochlorophyllide A dehydrogenase
MKAAVFEDIHEIIYREDYPKPVPGPDDVLVKVKYCGICGSDVTNFKYKMYQVPLVMGHEISGEVIELGSNVSDFKIRDKVICIVVSLDFSGGQLKGLGTFQDGGFAEFVRVPKEWVFQIPTNISAKEAVMIETFALAKRAFKLSGINDGENILIFGAGSVGMTTLKGLIVEKNPNYVVIVEPNEFLRNKALELGADDAVPPRRAKIKKVIKKYGEPTFIFDSVGVKETLKDGIFLIKKGGTILLEGIHKESIDFSFFDIISKEVTLKGSIGHDREDILSAIELFANDKVNANNFISEVISLKDIQTAFKRFLESNKRNFLKIIVKI